MRIFLFLIVLFSFGGLPHAQKKYSSDYPYSGSEIKWLRLAVKMGSPNLLGLELEGIVPGIGNWLGMFVGFTLLPIGTMTSETNDEVTERGEGGIRHIGLGANLYPSAKAMGFFLSLGYDRVNAYNKLIKSETGKKGWTNPTQMLSTQIGYKYTGRIIAYSFFAGYGLNFGFKAPDLPEDDYLFKKGNWIQAGFSIGAAFPTRSY